MRRTMILLAGAAIAVAGCHEAKKQSRLDAADNSLAEGVPTGGNDTLRAAIRVDPKQAGGAKTGAQSAGAGDCVGRYGRSLGYDKAWVGKLPPELPVKPGAQVSEAAGHDGGCALRIVSFTVAGTPDAVLGWYADKARAGGYTADRADSGGDRVLAGTKGEAAYYIMAGAPRGGATPIDYVWATTG